MPIPEGINKEKLAEAALAILCLTLHSDGYSDRAWKGMDWDVTDMLYQNGWILDPKGKAKSVIVTEDGAKKAEEFLMKHFGSVGNYRHHSN